MTGIRPAPPPRAITFVYRNWQGVARRVAVRDCRQPQAVADMLAELLDTEVAFL